MSCRKKHVLEYEKKASEIELVEEKPSGAGAWAVFAIIFAALIFFSAKYASQCNIKIGSSAYDLPWLLWAADGLFAVVSLRSILKSRQMCILNLLMFTIVFMVIGVMGYGWYLPEISALFLASGIAAGISAGYESDAVVAGLVRLAECTESRRSSISSYHLLLQRQL